MSKVDFVKSVADSGDEGVLVFVHGFNTDFAGAIFKLAQIVFDSNYGGLPIAFSWPSQGGFLNYNRDREIAMASRPALQELLELLSEQAGVKQIHVVAHSMGSQIVVDSLYQLSLAHKGARLSELVLAAPDVDQTFLHRLWTR